MSANRNRSKDQLHKNLAAALESVKAVPDRMRLQDKSAVVAEFRSALKEERLPVVDMVFEAEHTQVVVQVAKRMVDRGFDKWEPAVNVSVLLQHVDIETSMAFAHKFTVVCAFAHALHGHLADSDR